MEDYYPLFCLLFNQCQILSQLSKERNTIQVIIRLNRPMNNITKGPNLFKYVSGRCVDSMAFAEVIVLANSPKHSTCYFQQFPCFITVTKITPLLRQSHITNYTHTISSLHMILPLVISINYFCFAKKLSTYFANKPF